MELYNQNKLGCLKFLLLDVPQTYGEDFEGYVTIPGTNLSFTYDQWKNFTDEMGKVQKNFVYVIDGISDAELFGFARLPILIDIILKIRDDDNIENNVTLEVYEVFAYYLNKEFNLNDSNSSYENIMNNVYEEYISINTDEHVEMRNNIARAILNTIGYQYPKVEEDLNDLLADELNYTFLTPTYDNYFNPISIENFEFYHLYEDWYNGYISLPENILNEMYTLISEYTEESNTINLLELCAIKKESYKYNEIREEIEEIGNPRDVLFYNPESMRIQALNICRYKKLQPDYIVLPQLQQLIIGIGLRIKPSDWSNRDRLCEVLENYIEEESSYNE